MDMYYSRAINFGDQYEVADEDEDGIADIYASVEDEFEIFDKLEWHELQAADLNYWAGKARWGWPFRLSWISLSTKPLLE